LFIFYSSQARENAHSIEPFSVDGKHKYPKRVRVMHCCVVANSIIWTIYRANLEIVKCMHSSMHYYFVCTTLSDSHCTLVWKKNGI